MASVEFCAAVEAPSVHGCVSAQGEHLLLEEVGDPGGDSFHLEVQMKGLSLHQLHTRRIDPHLSHFMEGLSGAGDMKATNEIHLFRGGEG